MTTETPKFFIRGIPAPMVERFWQFAEPYVKRALDHTSGEYKPDDLKMLCKDRAMQLWLISEGEKVIGACTTEIALYPNKKHCRIRTLAGSKAPEWADSLDIMLQDWAKKQGCDAIEAFVRKGFVPVLSNYSYKHKYSVVLKEIT